MRLDRRIVPTFAFALALAHATTAAALTTQVGPIAGFNFSSLKISGQSGLDGRSSFAGGGVVDFGINDRFGIRIEPMYVPGGAKATHRNAYWGTMDGAVFNLDYLDVPILARYDLSKAEKRGYLVGGLGVAFATTRTVDLSQAGTSETVDFSDIFSSTDLRLDLGAGLSFPSGANRLDIEGQAAVGLMNINQGGTVTFSGTPLAVPSTSTRTLGFRLFATYLFSL